MSPLRISAVGDVGLVGRVAAGIRRQGFAWLLEGVAPSFGRPDVTIFNLEMPFASPNAPHPRHVRPEFRADPAHVAALSFPGVRVAALANNHVADFGPEGIACTRATLAAAGIRGVGAGDDLAEARRPAIVEVRGHRIGVLAYASRGSHTAGAGPGAAPADPEIMREDIASLRGSVDVVIVALHHGTTYVDLPSPEDRVTALALTEAGADLVIGHHPHVLQGTERAARSVVAHSLGEFIFDSRTGFVFAGHAEDRRRLTAVLRVEIGDAGEITYELAPATIDGDGRPVVPSGPDAEAARRRIDVVEALLRSPDYAAAFRANAAQNLTGHEMRVLAGAVRRFDFAYVTGKAARIRMRHVRMAAERLRQMLRLGSRRNLP